MCLEYSQVRAVGPLIWFALVTFLSSAAFAGSVVTRNGKPFFPIGIYHYPEGLPLQPRLEELAAAGFNTVLSPLATSLEFMDAADKYGIGVIVTLGGTMLLSSADDPKTAILRENVERLKGHPALLGYEAPDEIAWNDYEYEKQPGKSREAVIRGYLYIKSLDPLHPIWMNHAPRNSVDYLKSYSEAGDILGTDIYPVPEGYGHSDMDKSLNCVAQYTEKLDQVGGGKPIYMVLQGFEWDALPGHERTSWATPQPSWLETRFMAYDAVCHGANGIIYWGMAYAKVEDEIWQNLKRIASELRDLTPVLLDGSFQRLASPDPALEIHLKRHDGRNYLFVLNTQRQRLGARKIQLPAGWAESKARVLFEDRSIEPVQGWVSDDFEPYEVHIYTDDVRPDITVRVQNPAVLCKEGASLQVKLANRGASAATSFTTTLLCLGDVVATKTVASLGPMASQTVELAWVPNVTGNVTFAVVADPSMGVDELTRTNNVHVFTALVGGAKPDLLPVNISLNSQDQLCAYVLNQGFSDAHDCVVSCSVGGRRLADAILPHIPAGESSILRWSIPANATGSLICEIAVDPSGMIDELLEGNNEAAATVFIEDVVVEGPAIHVRGLNSSNLWIIKYDPQSGCLPHGSESCTLVWGVNGWSFPSSRPRNSRAVEKVCETPMLRGLDGLWYVIIPNQNVRTLEFKFRDEPEWGSNWDDNGGKGWRIVSTGYASGLLAELDRVVQKGKSCGADMSFYEALLASGWSKYLARDYPACLDLIEGQTDPAGMKYVGQLLGISSTEAESAKALGIDVSAEERLIYIAGKMLEARNYLSAEDYCTRALAQISQKRAAVGEPLWISAISVLVISASRGQLRGPRPSNSRDRGRSLP